MTTPSAGRLDPLSVARWLTREHAFGHRFELFAATFDIDTMAGAYDVPREFVALQGSARNVARAGYKIGLRPRCRPCAASTRRGRRRAR